MPVPSRELLERSARCAIVLSVLLIATAGTTPATPDTAAAEPAESSPAGIADGASHDGRIPPLDLAPYSAMIEARRLVEAGDRDGAHAALTALQRATPGFAPAALSLARLDATSTPRRLPADIDAVRRALVRSFPMQSLWMSRAVWWLAGSILAALTLLALARAVTLAAPLHHVLYERLSPATDERFARMGAGTLLALPFMWGLGALAAALTVIALGLRQPSRGDRWLLAAGLAAITMVATGAMLAPGYLSAPDYRHAAMVLATAQEGRLTPAIVERLDEIADDHSMGDLVRAIALRRSGRHTEAFRLLESYLRESPPDPVAEVAVGNCLLESDRPLRAAEHYQRALALDPSSVEAHYNQALALAGLLRFEESSRHIEQASDLDFGLVRIARSIGQQAPTPLEPWIPAGRFWQLYRSERAAAGLEMPLAVRLLLPWRGGWLWPLALGMVLVALLVRRALWRRLNTFECSICGHIVCRRCVRRSRSRIFCRPCAETLGEIPSDQIVRVLAEGRRRRRLAHSGRRSIVLACLLPGYGLLRRHRPALATLTLFLIGAGAMGLAVPQSIPALPPAPHLFEFPISAVLPVATLVVGLVAAVVLGLTLSERDLNRGVRGRLMPLAGPVREQGVRTGTDG
jgi:tetratricopeptide (TPR) repeat protein